MLSCIVKCKAKGILSEILKKQNLHFTCFSYNKIVIQI